MTLQVIDPNTFSLAPTIEKLGQDLSIISDPEGHRANQLRELFIANPKVAEAAATMMKINPQAASRFFGLKPEIFQPLMQGVTPDPVALATHTFLNTPGAVESLANIYQQDPTAMVAPGLAAQKEITSRTGLVTERQKDLQSARESAAQGLQSARDTAAMQRVQVQQAGAKERALLRPPSAAAAPKSPLTGKTRAQEVDDIQQRKNRINKLITDLQSDALKTTTTTGLGGKPGPLKPAEPFKVFAKRKMAQVQQIQKEANEAARLYPSEEWPTALPAGSAIAPDFTIGSIPATAPPTPVDIAPAPTVAPATVPFEKVDSLISSGTLTWEQVKASPSFEQLSTEVKDKLRQKYGQ